MWSSIHKRSVHIQTYHLPTSNANPHRNNAYLSPKSTRTIRIPYKYIIFVYLYLIYNPFISCSLIVTFLPTHYFCFFHLFLVENSLSFCFGWEFVCISVAFLNCCHCYNSGMHIAKSIPLRIFYFCLFISLPPFNFMTLSIFRIQPFETLIAISVLITYTFMVVDSNITSEKCAPVIALIQIWQTRIGHMQNTIYDCALSYNKSAQWTNEWQKEDEKKEKNIR